MSNRIDYIDTAKFLAIFFVLIGHCNIKSGLSSVLYAFHVQLFFIIYGYVHTQRDYSWRDIGKRVIKLFNRSMLPYYLLVFVLGYELTVKNFVMAAYGTGWSLYHPATVHLWFLPCYFVAASLFEVLRARIGGGVFLQIVVLITLGIVSAYFCYDRDCIVRIGSGIYHLTGFNRTPMGNEHYIGFPLCFNVALSGVVFMFIGSWLRTFIDNVRIMERKALLLPFLLICGFLGYVSYRINQGYITPEFDFPIISMGAAVYGIYFLFILTSVLFGLATISVAALITNRLFSKLGKFTMEIYCFHMVFVGYTNYFISKLNIPELGGFSSAFLLLVICSIIIPIIDWYVPSLKGSSCSK